MLVQRSVAAPVQIGVEPPFLILTANIISPMRWPIVAAMVIMSPVVEDLRLRAEAIRVRNLHGDRARAHIFECMIGLTLRGDQAGVDRWREIGDQLEQLTRNEAALWPLKGTPPHP